MNKNVHAEWAGKCGSKTQISPIEVQHTQT